MRSPRKSMENNKIPIDDLHAFAESNQDARVNWQYQANVHLTADGCVQLASQVAKSILNALNKDPWKGGSNSKHRSP